MGSAAHKVDIFFNFLPFVVEIKTTNSTKELVLHSVIGIGKDKSDQSTAYFYDFNFIYLFIFFKWLSVEPKMAGVVYSDEFDEQENIATKAFLHLSN